MKSLTNKEEEIMTLFWKRGPLFVKEILETFDEPKPHFNTVSTNVRSLEEKGFVGHRAYGTTYQYYPIISKQEYQKRALKGVINKYFNSSYLGLVSSLVKEEEISIEELKALIRQVEESDK